MLCVKVPNELILLFHCRPLMQKTDVVVFPCTVNILSLFIVGLVSCSSFFVKCKNRSVYFMEIICSNDQQNYLKYSDDLCVFAWLLN